jgi:hypothetical protein
MAPAPDGVPADIEERFMQSNHGNRDMSRKQNASKAALHQEMHAPKDAVLAEKAGLVALILLFLASMGFVVFGGAFEVAAAPDAQTRVVTIAGKPAGAGTPARSENAPGSAAPPAGYFPADYPNRGRGGDGNVKTYEHD